jgi:hypothetical protein
MILVWEISQFDRITDQGHLVPQVQVYNSRSHAISKHQHEADAGSSDKEGIKAYWGAIFFEIGWVVMGKHLCE